MASSQAIRKTSALNKLIRASAGSGKTYQLSGHFLEQLFLGAPPETILATTFTRKAAGEILGRVLERLANAATDEAKCAELARAVTECEVTQDSSRKLLCQLVRQLHRVRVSTLDSFFQQVARSLTLELGLSPGWTIADEDTEFTLRQRAIDAVLAQQDTHDARRLMQMLARGSSRRSIRSLIDDTVSSYHEMFQLTQAAAWDRIPASPRLTLDQLQHVLNVLAVCDLDGRQGQLARDKDVTQARAGRWMDFLKDGIAKKVIAGEISYRQKVLPDELIELYQSLIRHARAELLTGVARRNNASWQLIDRFNNEYQRLRSEAGVTGFSDVTRLLACAPDAVDGTRISFRLDSSVHHLLLDEFQDTSIDQWQVLRRLVSEITQKKSGIDRSIFCVGDPRQAIYGWRGGVGEILDEVERCVAGIELKPLSHSRRSAPAVIDAVNQVFRHINRHQNLDEYESVNHSWCNTFPEHTTHHSQRAGFAEFRTSPLFNGDFEEERTEYFRWIADEIHELHRCCPGSTIGVLTRRNLTVARLVHELTKLQVPASEEGGTPPTDSPAVLAVLSLLHLASHPGCAVSRFHVAGSPLAGIVNLRNWQDDEASDAAAREFRNRLMDDGYGSTLQWLAEHIAPQCSHRDRIRMAQVVAEGWRYDESPSLNPSDFVRLLEKVRFSQTVSASVRVMTVHQSKGLEFDIVVAPELEGPLFRPPPVAAGGPHPVAAPQNVCTWIDQALRSMLPDCLQQAFRQTTDQQMQGALCGLYVTMTRAKHALHLFTSPKTDSRKKSLAGLLAAAFVESNALEQDARVWSTGDELWFNNVPETQNTVVDHATTVGATQPRITLAPMPDGRRRRLARHAPSHHDHMQLNFPSDPPASASKGLVDGKTRGSLVHAWFETIQWLDDDKSPDPAELREVAGNLRPDELRIPNSATEALLPEFLQMIERSVTRSCLSREKVRQVMSRRLRLASPSVFTLRVETEWSFVFQHRSSIVQGTIDRLVLAVVSETPIAADILDFKTDRIKGDEAVWIAAKQADYAAQLNDYREAVHRYFRIPKNAITASLLLLEADVCVVTNPPEK